MNNSLTKNAPNIYLSTCLLSVVSIVCLYYDTSISPSVPSGFLKRILSIPPSLNIEKVSSVMTRSYNSSDICYIFDNTSNYPGNFNSAYSYLLYNSFRIYYSLSIF